MTRPADIDAYINFALYAIYGRMGEADELMRSYGAEVSSFADFLATRFPVEPKPIYRGIMLDPAQTFAPDPKLTFQSWSEDRGVAEWFACPRSAISEPLARHNPLLCGHLIELPAPSSRVLFHYSWAAAFDGFVPFALMHPHIGAEGVRQISWSLRTQREVITAPVEGLVPTLIDIDSTALVALERRLSPPWVVVEEGIRS